MIRFEGVGFSYGTRPILADFSLTCDDKKTTAVLGPSGCGKTTIVRLVCGLLRPTSGSISVADNRSSELGLVRGVLFQDDSLIPWLTVLKNTTFPGSVRKGKRQVDAGVLLSSFGLGHALDYLPSTLSFGMRKRVEFVRALLADDRFLVGDEPFTGLDSAQKQVLWDAWRSHTLRDPRISILVSHDVDEAIYLSDKIVVLSGSSPTSVVLVIERGPDGFPAGTRDKIMSGIAAADDRVPTS